MGKYYGSTPNLAPIFKGLSQTHEKRAEKRRDAAVKQQKQLLLQKASTAFANNDTKEISRLVIENPELRDGLGWAIKQKNKIEDEKTKKDAWDVLLAKKPEQKIDVLDNRIEEGKKVGADMIDTATAAVAATEEDVKRTDMMAKMVLARLDPDGLEQYEKAQGTSEELKPTKDMQEYESAKRQGFPGSMLEWKIQSGGKNKTDAIKNFEYSVKNPAFALNQEIKKDNSKTKEASGKMYKNTTDLRKEFLSQSKDYQKVRDAYIRVKASTKNPSPAGDLSLIFNYMKMLDPGSVVRESEFATAAATGDLGERMKAAAQKISSGERLSVAMRSDFLKKARELSAGAERQHKKRSKSYKEIAKRNNLPIEDVVVDITGVSLDLPEGLTEEDVKFNMDKYGVSREDVINKFGAK